MLSELTLKNNVGNMFSAKIDSYFSVHYHSSEMYSLDQGELLNAPCTGPVDDLTIAYFNDIIVERYRATRETYREAKRILDTASNFLK